MSKSKLFIASSIDGYISREDGNLDWLTNFPNPKQLDYGYNEFIASIDRIIMGRATYQEILGFGVDWPYANIKTYVLTTQTDFQVSTPDTEVINRLDRETFDKIAMSSKKNTWIIGGGQLINLCLGLDRIDEITMTIIPVILGSGIRLFPGTSMETWYQLKKCEAFDSGVVNLTYERAPR